MKHKVSPRDFDSDWDYYDHQPVRRRPVRDEPEGHYYEDD